MALGGGFPILGAPYWGPYRTNLGGYMRGPEFSRTPWGGGGGMGVGAQ